MSQPLIAAEAPAKTKPSVYPAPFAALVAGRTKRPLGDLFGLRNFGVNLTTLAPGSVSALKHVHSVQDEFIYVVSGAPTLVLGEEEHLLSPGMVAGFPAGGEAHQLRNDGDGEVVYLEIGDRTPGDSADYPDDDLKAEMRSDGWIMTHKDGRPY